MHTEDLQSLRAVYNERLRNIHVLQRNSKVGKLLIYLSLIVAPLFSAYAVITSLSKPIFESVGAVADFVLAIAFLWLFTVRWRRFMRPFAQDSTLAPAPEGIKASITDLLRDASEKMGVDLPHLVVYISKSDLGGSPSVVQKSEEIALVLPLGFLKILSIEPNLARSVLVHEIAHIEQDDTRLWSLSSIYWSVFARFNFPILFIVLLILGTGVARAYMFNQKLETDIASYKNDAIKAVDLSFDQKLQEIKKAPDSMDRFTSEQTLEIEKMSAELDVGMKLDQEERKQEHDLIMPTALFVGVALRLGMLLLVFSAIRSLRRLSERMADLAAVLYSDGATLISALERFGGKGKRHPFGLHPSTRWRITLIKRALEAAGTRQSSVLQGAD
jgi:Zn-dependent protease with chaperone function